ncbi:SNF2 family N-terminal domain-containing protein [Rhodotorula diobovata]|uniref:SNF2 family N-terminal domain-containing protein n=1 Tax=Rhodotorula diobovata TaxID=5288 RepID=A0A5C5G6T2_9BASI|nr:SNF2 family N-terminal domain-containing protein [Rhodotorula diobovata]
MAVKKEEDPSSSPGPAAPVASTSKLSSRPADAIKPDEDVKPTLARSSSPDAKGKGRALEGGGAGDGTSDDDDKDTKKPLVPQEDPEERALLASIPKANIVGLKYARGITTLKENMDVELRRDPYNVTDKNAIEVRHVRGQRIGYVAKQLSARLAPLVKERKIDLKGRAGEVPSSTVGVATVPMCVEIWGKRKFAADPRLDWLFPERQKRKTDEKRKKEALKQAKKELEEEEEEGEEQGAEDDKRGVRDGGTDKKAKSGPSKGKNGTVGGGGGTKGVPNPERDAAMRASILLDKKNKVDMLGSMFQEGAMDPAHLKEHPCPPGKTDGSMRTDLLPFQRQGLAWMIQMEHPELPKTVDDPPVQLWRMRQDDSGHTFYQNVVTDSTQRDAPKLKRGGILADEMGLGKTMQTVALICTDDTGEGVLDQPEEPDERYDDMTLIVCPLSVASNWTEQLKQHVGKKRLSWHFYHGEGRELTKKQLREHDVIITTYQTIATELDGGSNSRKGSRAPEDRKLGDYEQDADEPPAKKQKKQGESTLHSIKWRRVVLDEGHLIKNPKAKMTRACTQLKAERRWILSGTPIVNAAADLGTMLQFLHVCKPLDEPEVWKQCVTGVSDEARGRALRAVVLSTTLRRTKDMVGVDGKPLVQLPEVLRYQHQVDLNKEVRALYDDVAGEIGKSVKASIEDGSAKPSYTHILCLLLRLRQLACDPSLVPSDFIEDIRDRKLAARIQHDHEKATGIPSNSDRMSAEQLSYLRGLLSDANEAGAECLACGDWPADGRITICQHFFCQNCIEAAIDARGACPACSNALSREHIIAPPAERSVSPFGGSRASSVGGAGGSSRHGSAAPVERTAKVAALVTLLKSSPPGVKSLVFSQWTSHLDRIEAVLHEEGITTCRFDGSMRQDKRADVIRSFTTPNKTAVAGSADDKENPMVMLLSLKAGALGLNLTVASQVFLMDPWWQPAIELQAIDRVNRIGQTQIVRVFQLVAKGTIEERVLAIQDQKDALIAQAFSGNKNAPRSKSKIEVSDLASIFGV